MFVGVRVLALWPHRREREPQRAISTHARDACLLVRALPCSVGSIHGFRHTTRHSPVGPERQSGRRLDSTDVVRTFARTLRYCTRVRVPPPRVHSVSKVCAVWLLLLPTPRVAVTVGVFGPRSDTAAIAIAAYGGAAVLLLYVYAFLYSFRLLVCISPLGSQGGFYSPRLFWIQCRVSCERVFVFFYCVRDECVSKEDDEYNRERINVTSTACVLYTHASHHICVQVPVDGAAQHSSLGNAQHSSRLDYTAR